MSQSRLSREGAADKVIDVLFRFAQQYGEEMDSDTATGFRAALIQGEDYEWQIRHNDRILAIEYSVRVVDAWFLNFTVDMVDADMEPSHDLCALIDDAVGDYFLHSDDRKSRSIIRAFEAWLIKEFDQPTISQADRNNMLHSIRSGRRSALVAMREDRMYTVSFHRPNIDGFIVTLTYPDPVRRGSLFDQRLSDDGTQRIVRAIGRIDAFPSVSH